MKRLLLITLIMVGFLVGQTSPGSPILEKKEYKKKKTTDTRTLCGRESSWEAAFAKIRDAICAEGETKLPSYPIQEMPEQSWLWCVTFVCN